MKTKILLIGLTIFLVNVISVNARETIKSCFENWLPSGKNKNKYMYFPEDGSRPYGSIVEISLSFTNKLKLDLNIERDSIKNCFNKMSNGTIDIMANLFDKGDRRDYTIMVPYYKCNNCPANGHINLGISKKSKFASRVNEFKSAVLSQDDYNQIWSTKFTSADQHDWDVSIDDYFQDIENQLKELKKELKKKKRE